MATLAANFRRTEAEVIARGLTRAEGWPREADPYQLRPLPCENVYFYCKRIDNSRVVRETDPLARKKCWRAVSMSLAGAVMIMLLMLPDALGMMAGYQVHALERERERMSRENAVLELEEARLLSPERLRELARELRLVDPDPSQVVHLNPRADNSLALNVRAR